MSQFIDDIDQRTRMVGQNRMELLLFHLGGDQVFGINVFKVREVIARPQLRQLPGSSPIVCGIATIRKQTVAIINLARAIDFPACSIDQSPGAKVIVTEFNRSVQGFWVAGVDRIVNVNWDAVKPPPRGTGHESYLVAVTEIDKRLVEIIDVERVFAQINPLRSEISSELQHQGESQDGPRRVLVVDDSMVARKQIERSVQELGFEVETHSDGRAALEYLESLVTNGGLEDLALVISDIEMPRMDGYEVATYVRGDARLAEIPMIMITSRTGDKHRQRAEDIGVNRYLGKPYQEGELMDAIRELVRTPAAA